LLTLIARPAGAETATSTMLLTATVVNFCTISASPMEMLSYNIRTLCTPGVSPALSIAAVKGVGTSGTSTVSVDGGLIESVTTAYASVRSSDAVIVTISF
jgi:hypothetical protein